MNAIIRIKNNNDVIIIEYKNIKKVYRQNLHIIVECSEQYEVNDEEFVIKNNCCTSPYIHVYYNAAIVGAYE